MKWKNIKIGTKLTLAFGTIIILLLLIGGNSLLNTININEKASSLSDEYLPMSILSNNISSSVKKVIVSQQNFSYTLEKTYLDEDRNYLDSLKAYLRDAKRLTDKYISLSSFKIIVENTEKAVAEYESSLSVIENKATEIAESKKRAEQLKDEFNISSKKYLDLQKNIINYEITHEAKPYIINERLNRIVFFSVACNKATEAFNILLNVYSAQSSEKLPLAVSFFDEVSEQFGTLRRKFIWRRKYTTY